MDLNAIRAKLDSLNNNGQQREKTDYSEIFWKPQLGKQTIRIVPSAFDPAFPFKELKFHYGIGKYPMIALSNFGKQDPIEEFVKELRKTNDKDNWSLSGKINPKTRVFAPVVVRGEEDKGVRLWGFGITIYKALLALAEDEDVGDFTDPFSGRDITVSSSKAAGRQWATTSVRPRMKTSKLSDNDAQMKQWIDSIPDPDNLFELQSYEELSKIINDWLNGEDNESEGTSRNFGGNTTSTNTDDSGKAYKSLDDAFANLT